MEGNSLRYEVSKVLSKYGKEDEDFFVLEDSKNKVVVDISYMYNYIDDEALKELLLELKKIGNVELEVEYHDAVVVNKYKVLDGKIVNDMEIVDSKDMHAYLTVIKV